MLTSRTRYAVAVKGGYCHMTLDLHADQWSTGSLSVGGRGMDVARRSPRGFDEILTLAPISDDAGDREVITIAEGRAM